MDLGDRRELSPSANLTLISVLGQWDSSFFRGCGKLIQLHLSLPALEQVSANRYVTMVIYQKLLPRTKKRGVFYLSLQISLLNRLASYDEYPPVITCDYLQVPDTFKNWPHPSHSLSLTHSAAAYLAAGHASYTPTTPFP